MIYNDDINKIFDNLESFKKDSNGNLFAVIRQISFKEYEILPISETLLDVNISDSYCCVLLIDISNIFLNCRCIFKNIYHSNLIIHKYNVFKNSNFYIYNGNSASLNIANSNNFNNTNFYISGINKILIGSNCRFDSAINIDASDEVFNNHAAGKIEPHSIKIADNVRVEPFVTIKTTSDIPDGCRILSHSFVNRKISQEGAVIGGNPARILDFNAQDRKNKLDSVLINYCNLNGLSFSYKYIPEALKEYNKNLHIKHCKDIINNYQSRINSWIKKIDNNKKDLNGNIFCIIDKNNKIKYSPDLKNIKVTFTGKNSIIIINQSKINNINITVKDDSFIYIDRTKYAINNLNIFIRFFPSYIFIDENFSCASATFVIDEDNPVIIGRDCMFSSGITLRTSDGHAIISKEKKLLNRGKPIVIGNHVWVGAEATILKGAYISDNSIIGSHSLVKNKFLEQNISIAGIPGKIINRDINLVRENPLQYINNQNK